MAISGQQRIPPAFVRSIQKKKGAQLSFALRQNTELGHLRVPVEQFFGRLQQLWRIMCGVHRWDQEHFDLDINNYILLTNKSLQLQHQNFGLPIRDRDFLYQTKQEETARKKKKKKKKKAAKRHQSAVHYQENKHLRNIHN